MVGVKKSAGDRNRNPRRVVVARNSAGGLPIGSPPRPIRAKWAGRSP